MKSNVSFDPVDVSPFGMDGGMVQVHHAADLVKYFWFLVLTLRGQILYIIVNKISANLPVNQWLDVTERNSQWLRLKSFFEN